MDNVLSVAIDAVRGKIDEKYSVGQTSDALRNAFIEMNGGSTKINPKTFRPGNALFDLVQELLPVVIDEGIRTDENPLFRHVEYRNIAQGDALEFVIDGKANFVVATAAAGIQNVRRQRITGGETKTIPTEVKIVRVYENLGRLLAGRIDFNAFVDGVAAAFKRYIAEAAYAAFNAMTAATTGLNSTYYKSGSFNEATLLTLIENVEAATGKTARIYGTKTALRKVVSATIAAIDEAKSDVYNLGHYGRFYGTDMVSMRQAHDANGAFVLNDSKIFIIAGDDQPIKVVNEGEGLLVTHDATEKADLTQEYVYAQAMGVGAICAEKMGVYAIS